MNKTQLKTIKSKHFKRWYNINSYRYDYAGTELELFIILSDYRKERKDDLEEYRLVRSKLSSGELVDFRQFNDIQLKMEYKKAGCKIYAIWGGQLGGWYGGVKYYYESDKINRLKKLSGFW